MFHLVLPLRLLADVDGESGPHHTADMAQRNQSINTQISDNDPAAESTTLGAVGEDPPSFQCIEESDAVRRPTDLDDIFPGQLQQVCSCTQNTTSACENRSSFPSENTNGATQQVTP